MLIASTNYVTTESFDQGLIISLSYYSDIIDSQL